MKQNRNDIYVYAGWEEDKKIGTIYSNVVNGEEVVSFEYDPAWLATHSDLVLDPAIPLSPYREYSKDKMLFGAFTDSCPDRWGRKLIERREAEYASREGRSPKKYFETDYLLAVQDSCRTGGLRYKTAGGTEFEAYDDLPIPPITGIRELEQISLGYESNRDDRWVERLVYPGSSLGGARPKSNVIDVDGTLWIAKFPSRLDDYDVGAWEKVVHDMAQMCGIHVPASKICKYSELGSTFLVKRFDRDYTGAPRRVHFASAMTMLGLRDGKTDGTSFLDLAETVGRISCKPSDDLLEMFRRVVFDIAVSNQDDHLRNHGFLLTDQGWRLSPAYDINPVNNSKHLSLYIDTDDGIRSFEKVLRTCDFYHLSVEEAKDIIAKTAEIVAGSWQKLADRYEIKKAEQRYMASAFEMAKEFKALW